MKQIIKIISLFLVLIPLSSEAQLVVSNNEDWFDSYYLDIEGIYSRNSNGISELPKFRSLGELTKYFGIKNYTIGWTFATSNGSCYVKTEDNTIGIKDNGSVAHIYRHNCTKKDSYAYDPYGFGWGNKYYIVIFVEPYQRLNNQSVVVAVVLKSDSSLSNFYGEWDAFYFYK